ncbi:TIGR01620 family protein [Psychromarinibacter sp. C21-152]|uniref:TIGR01620 family protein n=1 Tax=Psychromarinibacter sediminicola TaxID=3033385 RepID=A0AAE3NP51_9RHOB|nr:TIGR01620 family protein [Psychromarinibacter sediminicola]MDF0599856.1 TIGR01620 family protein [Psychromarinibacter sediminicola]
MNDKRGPVLIEMDEPSGVSPAEAPPVVDAPELPDAAAMQKVAALAARRPSPLARWFWRLLLALVGFVVSVAAWDFVMGLLDRNPVLGLIAVVLVVLFVLVLLAIAVKEWAAYARLGRLDALHRASDAAIVEADLAKARDVTARLSDLYAQRPELEWGRTRLAERKGDVFDADGLLALAEMELLQPLDDMARQEVEAAARQVATVTAIVPLALADVITALTANLRMIRRVAEVYGGRAGTLGSWRLTRSVMTHLVATGAVAVGDDLIGSVTGGHVLSKISRRFGEGIVNGALTARVGVAAMEVCRPMPFRAARKPSVARLVQRALTGLFSGLSG